MKLLRAAQAPMSDMQFAGDFKVGRYIDIVSATLVVTYADGSQQCYRLAEDDGQLAPALSVGDLSVWGGHVMVRGRVHTMSKYQYRLIHALVAAQGAVVSRDALINAIFVEDLYDGVSESRLDAVTRRTRVMLGKLGSAVTIATARGRGFYLEG